MRTLGAIALALLVLGGTASLAEQPLTIYFIDVEGGQSTLVVTPSRQSLLIDAGYPGLNDRDPQRILRAAKDAGLDHLDYLFVTHLHEDHNGGVGALARQIPIGTFVDYGAPQETAPEVVAAFEPYQKARMQSRHRIAKVGESLPLDGMTVEITSANGETLAAPLEGAGRPNPACASFEPRGTDRGENPRSGSVLLTYGAFRFFDPGDLTWNKLSQLVCPNNLLGAVDVYLVSHHGNGDGSVPALLAAITPRVAIIDNGPWKGGSPMTLNALRNLEGLADYWQLHRSMIDTAVNAADEKVANLDEGQTSFWLKLTVLPGGRRFTILNERTSTSASYWSSR